MTKFRNILIVSIDESFSRELADFLEARQYQTTIVSIGKAALAFVEKNPPDLVLMDAILKDMSAAKLIGEIKKRSNRMECIILAGDAPQELVTAAIEQGGYGYVVKPYHLDHIAHIIRRIIGWIQTQEEVQVIQSQYRTMTESMQDVVWMMDVDFQILEASPSFVMLMGYSAEELTGLSYDNLLTSFSQDAFGLQRIEKIKQEFLDNPGKKIKIYGEFEYYRKDMTTFWCDTEITLLRDSVGKPVGYLGVGKNITERKISEQEFEKERMLLRTLIDHLPDFIYAKDITGRKTLSNRTDWEQLGAQSEADVLGKTDLELFPREIGEELYEDDLAVIYSEVPILNKEEHIVGIDGKDLWLLTSKIPLRDPSGEVIGLVGIGLDITEKKKSEDKLIEMHSWFKGVLDSTGSPIFSVDREYRYTSYNNGLIVMMKELFQEDVELGKSFLDVKHDLLDVDYIKRNFDRALMGEHFSDEFTLPDVQNENIYYEITYSPIASLKGDIQGIAVFIRDITKWKKAEKSIRLSEEKLAKIFNMSPDAILLLSLPDGIIFEANVASIEILGYKEEELINKTTTEIGLYENLEDRASIYKTLFKEGFIRNRISRMIRKSGEVFWGSISGNIVNITDKYFGLFIVRDVTDQKMLENRLYQSQKLESIGQLAAGIAHEINTPTQFVGDNLRFLQTNFVKIFELCESFHELLDLNKRDQQNLELVEKIEGLFKKIDIDYLASEIPLAIQQSLEGTSRISVIVNAMKSFSHPGGEMTSVDLNKAIQDTITVARNEWKYVATMEMDLEEGIPAVVCYPDELNQVFLNILVNAAQAIGEVGDPSANNMGKITISTRQDGEWVEIRIRDTGPGIPETIRTKIFDPFFTTKEVGKGTGQGLSISYNVIVNKHQGSLSFESDLGKGTVFIIRIPINLQG